MAGLSPRRRRSWCLQRPYTSFTESRSVLRGARRNSLRRVDRGLAAGADAPEVPHLTLLLGLVAGVLADDGAKRAGERALAGDQRVRRLRRRLELEPPDQLGITRRRLPPQDRP